MRSWQKIFYHQNHQKSILKKEKKTLPPLRSLTKPVVADTYPDREKEIQRIDYQEALFDASRSMIRFKKPQRLIRMIDKIINENIGVTYSAILIYDNKLKSYVLMDSRGEKGRKAERVDSG